MQQGGWMLRRFTEPNIIEDVCLFFNEDEAKADAALHGEGYFVEAWTPPVAEVTQPPVPVQIKRQTISAIVYRADGRVEDLGVILDTDKDKGFLARVRATWRDAQTQAREAKGI